VPVTNCWRISSQRTGERNLNRNTYAQRDSLQDFEGLHCHVLCLLLDVPTPLDLHSFHRRRTLRDDRPVRQPGPAGAPLPTLPRKCSWPCTPGRTARLVETYASRRVRHVAVAGQSTPAGARKPW
jgi:hypothetical protein